MVNGHDNYPCNCQKRPALYPSRVPGYFFLSFFNPFHRPSRSAGDSMNRTLITIVLALLIALLQGCNLTPTPAEQAQIAARQAQLVAEQEERTELALVLIQDEKFLALQPNILRGANWVECKTTLWNFRAVDSATYCKAEIPMQSEHRVQRIWVDKDLVNLDQSLNDVWGKYQEQYPDTSIRLGWRSTPEGTELFFVP